MQCSPIHKGMLAVACADGNILMWDTNLSPKPYHIFKGAHAAPVTALSFSPINKSLLASAGMDKKIQLYDIDKKTSVSSPSLFDLSR